MKNIKYLLLTLALIIIPTISVNALTMGKYDATQRARFASSQNYYIKLDTYGALVNAEENIMGLDHSYIYLMYCMDPALYSPTASGYTIQKLADMSSYEYLYNVGLTAIFENGYYNNWIPGTASENRDRQVIEELASASYFDQYSVTKFAIQPFIHSVYPSYQRSSASGLVAYGWDVYRTSAIGQAVTWNRTATGEAKEAIDYLIAEDAKHNYAYQISTTSGYYPYGSYTNQTYLGVAQGLYYDALIAMADALKNGVGSSNDAIKGSFLTSAATEEPIEENGLVGKKFTYELTAVELVDGNMTNFSVAGVSGNNYTISEPTFEIDGNVINKEQLYSTTLNSGDKLKVSFNVMLTKENIVEEIKYQVKYSFEDGTVSSSGTVLYASSSSYSRQRFLGYSPGNKANVGNGTITNDIELSSVDCTAEFTDNVTCEEPGAMPETAGTITESDNIKHCVISDFGDTTNTSSHLSQSCATYNDDLKEAIESPYCNVYCKEDYATFKLPGIVDGKSGRYFQVGMEISATQSCYTDEINIEQFDQDVQTAIDSSTNVTDANAKIAALAEDLNACSIWSTSGVEIPEIEYTYESEYMDLVGNDNKMTGTKDNSGAKVTYCTGDITDEYGCVNGNASNEKTPSKSISTAYGTVTVPEVSAVRYYSYSINSNINMITPRNFYISVPSGDVSYGKPEGESNQVDGLPLEFNLTTGLYDYSFKIVSLGTNFSTCDTGRTYNEDDKIDSVIEEVEEETGEKFDLGSEYVCQAKINCVDCDFDIEGELIPKPNPCPDCLFEIGDIFFRTYSANSLDQFNPNDRDLGYNWSYDFDITDEYGFVTEKAKATLGLDNNGNVQDGVGIIGMGNDAYAGEPIATINLTGDVASYLRDYNDENDYTIQEVECYDYTGDDGKVYENVFCYSTTLDDLAEAFPEEVTFNNRPTASERNNNNALSYFTPFDAGMPVPTPTSVGGPAWK